MSKTRKLLLVLLSLCFAVSLCLGVTVVSFAEGETVVNVLSVSTSANGGNASYPIRVDVNTNVTSTLGNSGNLATEQLSKVTYTRGDVSVPVAVAQGQGTQMFFYFQAGDSGLTLVEDTPERGDVFSIEENFAFNALAGDAYILTDAINYVYDGTSWVAGTSLPEEPDYSDLTPIEIESITVTDVVNEENTDTPFFVNTTSSNTKNFGDADYTKTNIRNYITFTYPSGAQTSPWYCRVNGRVARFFIRQEGSSSANINNGQIPVGSIMTIKAGFRILETEAVQEDISFIFNGTEWLEGTELPAMDAEIGYAETEASPFAANFPMRVDVSTNATNLGNQTNLNYVPGTHVHVTYTRGSAVATVGALHGDGSNIRMYFRSPDGATFESGVSEEGDILTVGAGFAFEDGNGTTYTVAEDVVYRFDGGSWVKASAGEYPTLITTEIGNVATNTSGNGTYPIVIEVETNASDLGYYGDMHLEANQLAKATYTRGDASSTATYVYSHGKKVLFWFRSAEGMNLVEDRPEAGDVFTVSGDFRFVSNNSDYADEYYRFEGALSYVFDGVGWIQPREIPDRDYESLTPITIESITTTDIVGNKTDSVFYINTTSSNAQDFGDADYDETYTMLPYISFVYPNGNIGDVWCVRVNGSVARLFIHEPGSQTNLNANTIPEGGVLTIRAGFGILATEALQEDISFVYNGEEFVELVAPDSADDYTIATPNNTTVKVGEDLQIVVDDGDTINAYYRYSVSDTSIATISSLGVLRGVKAGTVTVSVWYGDFEAKTVDIVVEALEQNDIASFEVVSDIDTFRIPVASSDWTGGNYFWEIVVEQGGYVLMGQYTLNSGTIINVEILEDEIADIDFSVAGTYALLVTDDLSGLTYELEIEIFTPREVGTYSSLGVSGYDVSDDRNASGTWNGHMMVGMNQYSTNTRNMTGSGTAELNALKDIASYIVYERADGTTYQNTNDDSPISVWQVSSNLLIMIRPDGYTGTKGYGVDSATGEDIPIYQQGDTITFKAGMPIYLYVGNSTNTEGYYVVEGVRTEDVTYYCYEDNGESSLWQLYIEYTDFTVDETMEIEVNSAVPVGATRVPADATTGTFSYESSDTSVVTINSTGTMVGMKAGTATITITLTGGKDAEGNDLAPITKTVQVTVVRGIDSVSGSITLTQNSTPDLSQYNITVTYTDGTTEEIPLNDERVVLQQDIDTSELGETTYNVLVTVGDTQARGTLTVTIVAESGGCSGSAIGAASVGIGVALLLSAGALLVVRKKKQK